MEDQDTAAEIEVEEELKQAEIQMLRSDNLRRTVAEDVGLLTDMRAKANYGGPGSAEAAAAYALLRIASMIGTDIALSAAEAAGYATKRAKAARARAAAAAAQPPKA